MDTKKKEAATKKGIKVRDLKPSKDAKGGARGADSRSADRHNADGHSANRHSADGSKKF